MKQKITFNATDKFAVRQFVGVVLCFLISGIVLGTQHWYPAGFGGGGLFLQIDVNPSASNILFLGSDVSGMYKSIDQGNNWSAWSAGMPSREIAGLIIDPSGDFVWAATPLGLYTNAISANFWSVVNTNIRCYKHVNYRGIAVSPNGQTILVAAHDLNGERDGMGGGNFSGKLYRSNNGGAAWEVNSVLSNLFPASTYTKFPSVAIDPRDANIFFLIVNGAGVMKSPDGGISWDFFTNGLPDGLNWKNLDVGSNVVYATAAPSLVYKSPKNISAWQIITNSIIGTEGTYYPTADAIRVTPFNDETVFFGQDSWPHVFYRSSDGGQNWTGNNVPGDYLFNTEVSPYQNWIDKWQAPIAIETDPNSKNFLYYTTWWGAWRSGDAAGLWEEIVAGAQNTVCTDIAAAGDTLFSSHMDVGVLTSTNEGLSWICGVPKDAAEAESLENLHAWCIEKSADGKIYAGLTVATNDTFIGPKVFRSDDNGVTWTDKSAGLLPTAEFAIEAPVSLASDPHNPGVLYCGVDSMSSNGLFQSTDFGDSWTKLPNAPGSGFTGENMLIKCLEVDPVNTNRIFAGLYWDGLWYSENGGDSWNLSHGNGVNLDYASVQKIVARDDGVVFAAYDNGLYKSTDNGHTFSVVFTNEHFGETSIEYVYGIALNPPENEIFICTSKNYPLACNRGSVWFSNDDGVSWYDITGDLPVKNVVNICYKAPFLYSATWGGNIYRTEPVIPEPGAVFAGIFIIAFFRKIS